MEAWIKRLGKVGPRLQGQADIIRRAALYEELATTDGWKDFIGVVTTFREQLQRDLLYGQFQDRSGPPVSDREIRAMLYMCSKLLSVPALAAAAFDNWRDNQDIVARAQRKGLDRLDNHEPRA